MPPSSSSTKNANSNAGAMVASLCQAAEHKQAQLRQQVSANHGHAQAAAQHLAVNGNVQRLLESLCPDVLSEQDVHEFLAEQRDRLKQVAVNNANNELAIQAFAHTCQKVRQDALRASSGSGEKLPEDFSEVVSTLMSSQMENLANHSSVQKFVHEIKVQLKEEKEKILGVGDDDDDIEVVDAGNSGGAGGGTTQGNSLKCPLTCTFSNFCVRHCQLDAPKRSALMCIVLFRPSSFVGVSFLL
jgi:hypothetical protein